MPDALLEIGTEEIPARFMPGFLEELRKKAENSLSQARLKHKGVWTLGTPRRLTLYIRNLAEKQEDLTSEVKGPSKEAAYKEGKPTQAAQGFAKSQGARIKDLVVKPVGDKEYVFAWVAQKGISTEKILPKLFPEIVTSLYLPLSMKWGTTDLKFVRPIHWILALYGTKIIKFELGGIKSSHIVQGHRFLGKRKIVVKRPAAYLELLAKNYVIVDQEKRRELILKQVAAVARRSGGKALIEEDLLAEVTYLVEYPYALAGRFDEDFLRLPRDVLVTVMKKNLKFFPIEDKQGNLMPTFVAVVNGVDKKYASIVKGGNERVLAARLSDAKFFYDEDMKVHFYSRVEDLKKVAYHEKLGSIFQRTERTVKISEWMGKSLGLNSEQMSNVQKIAQLSKADLVTHMVKEFSELEGIMGREYALKAGESKTVSTGIYEHYLPRRPGGDVPSTIEGAVVGLADKIDSIMGCFAIGLIPTGSEDPYSLRRQAYGIVSIILGKEIVISLSALIKESYEAYKVQLNITVDYKDLESKVLDFLAERLKGLLLEEKVRHDVAEAVLSTYFDDLLDSYERAKTLVKVLNDDWFKGVFYTGDRVARLAINAKRENVIEDDFVEDTERNLYRLFLEVKSGFEEDISRREYESALKKLAELTQPVDNFFLKVMVMVEDEKLKSNRLALLKTIEKTYRRIADFTKLVM